MKTKESCENFDDGVTQVAPKGDFKVEKEFNLSEKIEELGTHRVCSKCSAIFKTQFIKEDYDKIIKEFIRQRDSIDRLKMLNRITWQEHADKCDKLAGEKLNGNL